MMFRDCLEQCMMISVFSGAVHQAFRGKYTSQCPAGRYCLQGLTCNNRKPSWVAVGEPCVTLSQFDGTLRQGEESNHSRRGLVAQLNILAVIDIPVAPTMGRRLFTYSVPGI